jgi:hypothetical protein
MENKSNKELAKLLRMYIKHQREKRANVTWKQDPFMELLDICADRLEELEDKEDTYKRGEWDLFCLITSVEYGKQRFCDDFCGTVYDRSKCDHLNNRDEAIDRYLKEIGDDGEY